MHFEEDNTRFGNLSISNVSPLLPISQLIAEHHLKYLISDLIQTPFLFIQIMSKPNSPTPINQPYGITGVTPRVKGPDGAVPLRQNCDDWSKANPIQANLFILALRFYVDMDPLDRDSFWQTAGEYR